MASFKQNTKLKQNQSLVVTPQMQQSIKLLQFSRKELEDEIVRVLSDNVMLQQLNNNQCFQIDDDILADHNKNESIKLPSDIPDSIDCDFVWEDTYDDYKDYQCPVNINKEYNSYQEDRVVYRQPFDEKLENSIYLSNLNAKEKRIARDVLLYLDDNYFLKLSPAKLARKLKIPASLLTKIINVIKHLDPPGVASQDIQECMLAQLHSLTYFEETIGNAHDILTNYFNYIGKKDSLIKQRLNLDDTSFNRAICLIRKLSPYPDIDDFKIYQNITPDIFVCKKMDIYYASLNNDNKYDIGINEKYIKLTKNCQGDEKKFVDSKLQSAKFFLKALKQRNNTILRVGNAIVMQQQEYFSKGPKAIKPLLMKDLANTLDLSPSTISRAVNNKYLSFNRKLIEFRYFFSNKPSTNNSVSSVAVKELIKKIIDSETLSKPMSDSKIAKELHSQGINIARRTVTKYRKYMGILATNKRKFRN